MFSADPKVPTRFLPSPSTQSIPSSRRPPARRVCLTLILLLLGSAIVLYTQPPSPRFWRDQLAWVPCHGSHYTSPPSAQAPDTTLHSKHVVPTPRPAPEQAPMVLRPPAMTTQRERTALLLQALVGVNPPDTWVLPSNWADWLLPVDQTAQAAALDLLVLQGRTSHQDASLYRSQPLQWTNQHSRQGVVVFSDGDTESQDAIRFLSNMDVHFTVVRSDPSLCQAWRRIAHESLPTVVIGTTSVGGTETLHHLSNQGVLQGILRAADAL